MLPDYFKKEEVHSAAELIRKANSVAIIAHMSPDGDAIGSSLAMKHFLQNIGKVLVAVLMPNNFPDFLHWADGANDIIIYDDQNRTEPENQAVQADAAKIIKNTDLIICLDFNDLKRIGKLQESVEQSSAKILLIDHHLNPQHFADAIISYPESPSTSELIFRLICALGQFGKIDLPTAECIYMGMMTDTGNFSFNSDYVDTYTIIAELVRIGVDKDSIYNKVYNTYSADRMRLMGYCLYHSMKIYPEQHTALIALSRKELYKFNFQSGDAEGLVNLPLQIKDVYYSVFMRADKDKIKISFRSQGDRPVNEFAAKFFNGGGHKNAAGGESYDSIENTIKKFEENFKDYFTD